MQTSAVLYVVATPIGNLEDITARALSVLSAVDFVAAEDTRHSKRLLAHFGIATPLLSHHEFSSDAEVRKLLGLLAEGKSLALISDAGTPLISDPGYRLVAAARDEGVEVIPVPGASALTAALSVAGIPSDSFRFEGFLPAKSAQRIKRLESLVSETPTLIFYESPHRIASCLTDLAKIVPSVQNRKLFVGRELTKKFETHFWGSPEQSLVWLESDENNQRGEFVLVLEGAREEQQNEQEQKLAKAQEIARLLAAELSMKRAVALAAEIGGVRKNALYALMLRDGE
jgi:16S rRNA (cytidine1402-2'-O)-methyltransferase